MDDNEVVSGHLPPARLHLHIPAVVGVYLDVEHHLGLNANPLHMIIYLNKKYVASYFTITNVIFLYKTLFIVAFIRWGGGTRD